MRITLGTFDRRRDSNYGYDGGGQWAQEGYCIVGSVPIRCNYFIGYNDGRANGVQSTEGTTRLPFGSSTSTLRRVFLSRVDGSSNSAVSVTHDRGCVMRAHGGESTWVRQANGVPDTDIE